MNARSRIPPIPTLRSPSRLAVIVGLAVLAGCNRSDLNLAPVEGIVTYQGAPVAEAGVLFKPTRGPLAMGATDEQGRFTLITANQYGALVGDHTVTISKTRTTVRQVPGKLMPVYEIKALVPPKYSRDSTSGLTANVEDDVNHFEFNLTGSLAGK